MGKQSRAAGLSHVKCIKASAMTKPFWFGLSRAGRRRWYEFEGTVTLAPPSDTRFRSTNNGVFRDPKSRTLQRREPTVANTQSITGVAGLSFLYSEKRRRHTLKPNMQNLILAR